MTTPATGPAPAANMRVNPDRLWDSLMEMAKIGPGIAGGNNRQTLTDEDGEARRLFQSWCEAEGMAMEVDRMGNMFMRFEGADPEADPVHIGSHLDTQPTGGKYDGVLGVLAGLEVVRSIKDMGLKTRRPIVVVNWTNEEGTRFAPAMLASGVYAGAIEEGFANDREDAEGKRFGDELERIGWKGEARVGGRPMHAMFEYHIEQGPILEAEGKQIGVVTHGQGLRWIECTVTGKASHTGSTPMRMRKNAGRGMARLIELVHEIAMKHQPNAVGAVGHIEIHPNSRNIIPERAVFTVDFRSHQLDVLTAMVAEFEARGLGLCEEIGVTLETGIVGQFDPPEFDKALVARVRESAERLGYSHMDIVSGAGHDACWINKVAPTVMIMCPCVDGLSHNEAEEISKEWASAGADVLLNAVLETAEVVG
ncbi:hydantoinase/carbamoylase family amidase [Paracoccus sp. S-4012]|uniref:Zn-dependent hydrolase n=1 Tax=Paracoccus sp. S-4012 TaxID=2665648 RepID=UPI0012B05614|nr:Zn-dependent hydrolase [Paracoccus sp. S-4012]MRX50828.1 hydantoinase/carbamoylase family amidase [Paracoccus sp. S-4012]